MSVSPDSSPPADGSRPGRPAASRDAEIARKVAAAVQAADYGTLSRVVRDGWFPLLRSHGDLLRRQLDSIPPSALRMYPLLTMMLGICYNGVPHRRVKALRHFATAVRAARSGRREVDAVDRALILVSESAAYRLVGRPAMGVGAARAALAALDALAEEDRRAVDQLPRVYAQAGISLYYGGRTDEALDAFAVGLAESPEGAPSSGFANLSMSAGIHALDGRLDRANEYLGLARADVWSDEQRSMYPGTFYRVAEAVVALERIDPPGARAQLDAMVHDRRTIEHWVAIGTTEANIELFGGRPGDGLSGLDALAALRGAEGRSAAARAALAPTRALLQLAMGNLDAATAILRRDAPAGPRRQVGLARVALTLGRNGEALRELRSIAGVRQDARSHAEALTVEAAALLRFSRSTRAEAVIDQLAGALRHSGQRAALALVPPPDLDGLVSALAERGHAELTAGIPLRSVIPGYDPQVLLSEREVAVLALLMETGSASRIADELTVSVNTVKTQLRSIYRKLGVSSRDGAIAVALDQHLLARRDG
ncbi:helix-turn-helix transcriptional regulator [Leifsonia poae]|uniref:helix-turn-helix transcriptional regulator n=1 Tax=Leifsonia poae TaxID=110933 RepID=UPI001CBD7883|nr:LuxR family transcriptional regulator [Leifsonia poae]